MRDKQAPAAVPKGSVPVISPILHCLSMPVLVILRHSFGYSYLSPKSIFLALCFASGLFGYAVWHDETLKSRFALLAGFAALASSMYVIHLTGQIFKQARGKAEHDQDAGISYLYGFSTPAQQAKRSTLVQGLVEPLLIIGIGYFLSPDPVGAILLICGVALFFKELIRNWLAIRLKKRITDNFEDAKVTMAETQIVEKPKLSTSGRTPRERYSQKSTDG